MKSKKVIIVSENEVGKFELPDGTMVEMKEERYQFGNSLFLEKQEVKKM